MDRSLIACISGDSVGSFPIVISLRASIGLVLIGVAPGLGAESPLHHWKLAESQWEGAVITEMKGSLEGTALQAPAFEDGAVVFDGANRIRVQGITSDALPSDQLSADAWVMIGKGQRWGNVIGYMQDNGDYERGWSLGYNEKGFTFWVSNGGRLQEVSSKTSFEPDQWYHIAGTYDGAKLKLYVNGRLETTSDAAKGPIAYPDTAFYTIGAYQDKDEFYPMSGRIREARLFDKALVPMQIAELHASGRKAVPSRIDFAVKPALR